MSGGIQFSKRRRKHDESCTPNKDRPLDWFDKLTTGKLGAGEDRKTTSLYKGAKMRVWYKKSSPRRHEEHEEES